MGRQMLDAVIGGWHAALYVPQHDHQRCLQTLRCSVVVQANIMKKADGLFLECCREVAAKYPDIQYEELIVDNCCMQLVCGAEIFRPKIAALIRLLGPLRPRTMHTLICAA